jgi:LysR family hydrogen peroxide-inducible transcriptional activator
VPKGHPFAQREKIPACEVRGEEVLVLKAGNCFREQVLDACPEISHAEGSTHEGHSIETVRCMVASGYGISVLPAGATGGIYKNDLVVSIPFEEPAPSRRVALAWRQGFTRPQAIEAIIQAVRMIKNPSYRLLA